MTRYNRGVTLLITAALLALTLYGCDASSNTGTAITTTAPATVAPTKAPTAFKVGQVVKVGDTWQVTVTSAKVSPGGQFDSLKAGDTFLEVGVTLQNISSQEQNVSSLFFFTLRDPSGQGYNQGYLPDAPQAPEGKVEAGSSIKGTLVYEVPSAQKTFLLAFSPDIGAPGQTVWSLSV